MTETATRPPSVEPLEEGCAWRAGDVGDDYVWQLDDDDIAELEAALAHAEAHTEHTLDITAESFPLPTLGPRLAALADELIGGRGVALIRGLPVERYGPRPCLGHLLGRRHAPRAGPGRRTTRATCSAT